MPADAQGDRQPLITRQFVVVTAATLAFFTYVGVLVPLLPTLVETGLGGNKFDIGLMMASFSVAAIACRPLLAKIGERVGMRALMVTGAIIALCATIGAAFVESRYLLLPFRGLQGVGEAFVFVGGATVVTQSTSPSRRAEAASYYSVGVFVGLGLGPVFADHLVNAGRYRAAFFVGCGFVVLAGLLSLAGPRRAPSPAPAEAQRGPRFHRGAILPGVTLALGVASFSPFTAYIPDHARSVGFGGSALVFGLYTLVCVVVRVGGARLPQRLGLVNAVTGALVGIGTGMFLLAIWPAKPGVLIGTVALAVGVSLLFPSLSALASNTAAEQEQVRMMSTFTMFFEIGVAVGGIGFGLVANMTNQRGAFAAAASVALIGVIAVRTQLTRRFAAT